MVYLCTTIPKGHCITSNCKAKGETEAVNESFRLNKPGANKQPNKNGQSTWPFLLKVRTDFYQSFRAGLLNAARRERKCC